MTDQLTNKEILAIYLSMQDSKDFMNKNLKFSLIKLECEEQLLELESGVDKEKEMVKRVKELLIHTADRKLKLINGIIEKFYKPASLIIDSSPELYEEVKKIIYNKDIQDEFQSLIED